MMMMWIGLVTGLMVGGQQEARGGARVAVVNVPRVSEQYRKTADLEAHFVRLRDNFAKERDAQQERIKRLKRSLQEELKPGTDDYRQRAKQAVMLEAELAWFVEMEGQRIEEGLRTSLLSIFTDILVAVREVAGERGIELVLTADQLPSESPSSATQVRQQILLQKVLYWSPRLDITSAVVERLNTRYQQRAENKPASSAGGPSSLAGGGSQRAPAPSSIPPSP